MCHGLYLKIYEAPKVQLSYEPLRLLKKIKGRHADTIKGLNWSPDSRFVSTWSNDLTVQIHNVFRLDNFQPFIFSTHKHAVRYSFFADDMKYFDSIDRNSVLCVWKWVDDFVTDA